MKVLTCQFYSVCFYASAAWLHGQNCYKDLRKLNAVHYRSNTTWVTTEDSSLGPSLMILVEQGQQLGQNSRCHRWLWKVSRKKSQSDYLMNLWRPPTWSKENQMAKITQQSWPQDWRAVASEQMRWCVEWLSFDWTDGFLHDGWRTQLKNILVFQLEVVVFPLGWGTNVRIKKSQFSTSCPRIGYLGFGNIKFLWGSFVTICMQVFDNNMTMEDEYFIILSCRYRQLLQSFVILCSFLCTFDDEWAK